ncbi:MAG: UDP-N-acetylmuramoyl-tripeptide--D-alanyl-D-alanine ligase [Candidatus Brocadiales bacterium]
MEALWGCEVLGTVKGKHLGGRKDDLLQGVSIDTRTIQPGELFVAIKGNRFDGHDFLDEALERGAKGILISKKYKGSLPDDVLAIKVRNTTKALGVLARYYREKLPAKVVGITGTNGKTTTKDMLHQILSPRVSMVSTRGNLNNDIGVPLSIFQMEPYHDLAVIEMGTSSPGEILRLSWIVQPDIGVITNVSEAHLEGLGDIEDVAKEKSGLLENLTPGGTLVFNVDDFWCKMIAKGFPGRKMSFGIHEPANVRCRDLGETKNRLTFSVNGRHTVELPSLGIHNVYNALAALTVCYELGLNLTELSEGLKQFEAPPMRMERHRVKGVTIIMDGYNANPSSMKMALDEYSSIKVPGRRFFVCGDMAELGGESSRLHRELGREIARSDVNFLLTTGEHAGTIARAAKKGGLPGEKVMVFGKDNGLREFAVTKLKKGDAVLIKGSRCMKFENLCEELMSTLRKKAAV